MIEVVLVLVVVGWAIPVEILSRSVSQGSKQVVSEVKFG